MKVLTFHAPEALRFEDAPDPVLSSARDAIIRVKLTAICGSDLHVYHGRESGLDAGTVMGHEFVGEIVDTGSEVDGLPTGSLVVSPFTTSCGTCFFCERGLTARCTEGELFGWVEGGSGLHGGQAEYVRVPLADSTLAVVPDDLPLEAVLFAGDVLSTGAFCAEQGGVGPDTVIAVIGCGPVGLMAVLSARELEAKTIYALDTIPERLELARGLGAIPVDVRNEDAVDVLKEATNGRGADVVLEAVGSEAATRSAYALVRPGGTISAAGVHTEAHFAFSPGEAYDKNLTYRAGRCSARHYLDRSLELIRRGLLDTSTIVSHRLPLEEGVRAYDIFARRLEGCTKVVLST